jgi:phage FluMu gp28-like protein
VSDYLRTERAEFLFDFLDLPAATGVEDAIWEHFQIEHLNDDSTFRIENKSRQIAWSWLVAAEAVAEVALNAQSTVFVSINQEEAQEKIRYARAVYEALRIGGLPRLVRESLSQLEFDNGARLISHPGKAPRGKPRFNVVLDEFAHAMHDRAIYTGSVPVLSKGGRMRIGSSPFGAMGTFWEIYSQTINPYPMYRRKRTPWWEVQAFCTNVKEALRLAPGLTTDQRVEMFGTDRIKAIRGGLALEDFQQEYEAAFVDESASWITFEEIKSNQVTDLLCLLVEGKEQAQAGIDQLASLIRQGRVEPVLAAGVDIGRTRNATEIFFVGITTVGSYPLRLTITLQGCPFDDQLGAMAYALKSLPLTGMLIDRNGIGRNLAENLETLFPGKAFGVDFTGPNKTLWATDAKMLVQQRRVPLPVDREIAYQIHSIKRKVTAAKNLVFDTEGNEKHHADKFWAWTLACIAATAALPRPDEVQTLSDDDRVSISPY